jgi:hypothetical protein
VWISKGVGHKHAYRSRWHCTGQLHDLRQNAKLSHGERSELHFERDEPPDRRVDRPVHGACTFIHFHGLGNTAENTEEERARTGGRIGERDCGRCESCMQSKSLGA